MRDLFLQIQKDFSDFVKLRNKDNGEVALAWDYSIRKPKKQ